MESKGFLGRSGYLVTQVEQCMDRLENRELFSIIE